MAYDFRANQIRLNRIISSGSIPIYIYPSSSATNLQGGINFSTSSIGTDVFLFVSGSSTAKTLFGGDVVASGSIATTYVSSSTGARITGSMTNGAPGVVAFGVNSHAEGDSTTAVGQASHAEGSNTGAGGDYAHSEGLYSQAVGAYSHAEGQIAYATGLASHAEGLFTLAIGNNSHAEGIGSEAFGTGSLAAGLYTVASGAVDGTSPTTTQASFGKYNLRDNIVSLFVVGDGLDDSNRHDVLRVNSGSVQITGSLIASTITGSISGTVAGNPFIVAGSNITANYNSLGQWEITGSGGGGGGSNLWLELDASTIYTTSSIRVAGLSASFGAIITGSVVQGTGGIATGQYSHSEGYEADVTGNYGHAEGYQTDVTGTAGHAEGNSTTAAGDYSHAEGINTDANGNYSHAEGRETLAAGEGSHAAGRETQANGDYSHTIGTGSIAAGNYSFAAGNKTEAFADYQTAVGKFNVTSNSDSLFVVGDGLDVSNRHDVLRVNSGSVGITGSFTQGSNLSATGTYSHAEGLNNTASGYASHAEGVGNTASNFYAHAEGANTTASGLYTHAEGQITIASGQAAHAEGYGATASGLASHAEGHNATASGLYSHAEGSGSIASGLYSHAEGITTLAIGTGSFAAGLQTISYGSIDGTDPPTIIQAAFGKYNLDFNADSLFVVGDGLDGSNRHDVLRINSGSVQVTGSFIASKITGSLSGTVAGNPFIAAGSNITANYNSLGQWEITGSGGGGGTNFFTELALNSIETTGSVAMTYLSSSTGAQITGSFILSSSIPAVILTSVRQGEPSVTAPGLYAYSQGTSTAAQGNYSHAEGNGCVASGQASHAEGFATLASNSFTHSEGYQTAATGPQSHAEGQATTASGDQSHAEGYITTASNFAAHAEGYGTIAAGPNSHAEGYSTSAGSISAGNAHSEGAYTIASGDSSHAEGAYATASGVASHAQGWGSKAYGAGSLAAGLYTIASGSGPTDNPPTTTQAAFGKYNLQGNNDSLFVIGDGLNTSNRHDVLRVNSGSVQVTGSFEVTGTIKFDTITVSPLYATMTTSDATGTVLSGSLLTSQLVNASVGKLDFNVLAAAQATDDYASFTFSTTIRRTQAGSTLVIASTELDSAYDGANAATWDVNINSNGDIVCTGSAGTVHWYAQVTKKMVLSGSSVIVY